MALPNCTVALRFLVTSALIFYGPRTLAQTDPTSAGLRAKTVNGPDDFDFSIGLWRTHISRRLHPLIRSDEWADYEGTSLVRKIWNGRGSLEETEADGPAGHLEALSLRLYNRESHQWTLHYASAGGTTSTPTALTGPTTGEFKNGRGEFFDTEVFNGRSILVRNVWSDISAKSIRFEQAFSDDGGRTWEINWIAVDTRADSAFGDSPLLHSGGTKKPGAPGIAGQHDFDFEFGIWKAHIKRLAHPLASSQEWIDYEGTSTLSNVWGGRANIGELEVDGPTHIEPESAPFQSGNLSMEHLLGKQQ